MVKTSNERANELALKQQFLDRARTLSKLPEVFRCQGVTQLIRDALAFGVRAEAEIFQAVYGDPEWTTILGRCTYQKQSRCIRSRTYFRFTWQKAPSSWKWRKLQSFAPFEMRPKLASAGSLEKSRHFWPWKIAKPISRSWVRSKLIRVITKRWISEFEQPTFLGESPTPARPSFSSGRDAFK